MIRILVTGAGSLLGQGIIKSIKNSNLKCELFGTDYFSSAVGLYWVDQGYILPDILKKGIQENEWLKSIVNIINKKNIDIVIPGLDFEIPVLSKHKSFIEKNTKTIVLVNPEKIVSIGNDKWETVKFLKTNNFNYPNSCLPNRIESFLDTSPFPFIVKPRFGHTSKNVFLVNNQKELSTALGKCDKPIIQEYLNEEFLEFTCGSTMIDNEIISLISLRRILKNGNTQEAYSEETKEVDNYIKNITQKLNPFGPINFQLRMSNRGPVVFEINPRFSGTTPLRALFGVNEVEAVIKKIMKIKDNNKYKKRYGVIIRYFENEFIPWEKYLGSIN
jgi:carbamoyl-phosphate synthase large subunit